MLDTLCRFNVVSACKLNSLIEYYWDHALATYTDFQILVLGTSLIHEIAYILLCLPGMLSLLFSCCTRFKIQKDETPSVKDIGHVTKVVVLNQLLVQTPLMVGVAMLVKFWHIPIDFASMPNILSYVPKIIICMLLEDAWHFFLHYIMHDRRLYKYIHKWHHMYPAPFSMVSEYAHPLETVVLGMGTMWGVLLFLDHIAMAWIWMAIRMLETADVHSGYDFPLHPLSLLPFYGGAKFHDFHHSNYVGNYSSSFTFWDQLFDTDLAFRKHELMKQLETSYYDKEKEE